MPYHTLAALLALLGRPGRYEITSEPALDQPVTTSAHWPCGCSATGPSYRELLLSVCIVHGPAAAGTGTDGP